MSRKATTVGIVLLVAAGMGLAWLGWQTAHGHGAGACDACGRTVHVHSRTEGMVEEKQEVFCCPACALTLHRQTGEEVRITALTDYGTGSRVDPSAALIVFDSNLNLCLREEAVRSEQHTAHLDFDRCVPSMVAFASRSDAESFTAQHGGRVLRFDELEAAFAAITR